MTTKPTYTPALRFPDFLNDGEWEVKRLGEIVKEVEEKCSIGKLDIDTYISTENMLQNLEGVKKASKLPETGSFTRFQKGDILFSNIRPYLKKVWQAEFEGAASNDVIVFRAQTEYDSGFVSQIIKSDSFIAHTMAGAKGVKMPRGDKNMMLEYPVCVPPLPEQRRIAQALTALDELIAATNEKLEQMKAYKKGLMQKLFPAKGKKLPELRFKEFEKDGEWEEKRLGDVVEIYDGIHQTPNYTKKGVMFVSVEDISTLKSNKFISEEDFFRDFKVYPQRGDILMTRIGNIGIANVYDRDELLAYYVSLALFKPKSINSYFLKQSIDSYYFQYQLSIKTLHIAFPKKINKTELESILVYCPSIPEQRKIADCLTLIDEMINQYTNKAAILELYKKGLMQQMFPTSK